MRLLLLLSLLLPVLSACSSTEGGSLEVRVRESSFGPLQATELGRIDDLGDVVFDLDQPGAPDDSFGFTISWAGSAGSYVMQSGAGDPEQFAGENAHFQLEIPAYSGSGRYSTGGPSAPAVLFHWVGEFSDEGGSEYQAAFEFDSAEGGSCEASVDSGGLSGSVECLGMSPTIDGSLVPSGLLELKATWVGQGKPRS